MNISLFSQGRWFGAFLLLVLALAEPSGLTATAVADPTDGWKEVTRFDAMVIYRKEIPGSDILAFKGEGTIPAPIGKLVTVITQTERRPEWTERVKEARVLRVISPLEKVEYVHAATPFPFKDRDMVYQAKMSLDRPNRKVTFQLHSIEDPLMPEQKNLIRGWIYNMTFTLTPTADGRSTYIVAEAHADPRGGIPKWLVNFVQKSWPKKSVAGLLKQVTKPDIHDHPMIAEMLAANPLSPALAKK